MDDGVLLLFLVGLLGLLAALVAGWLAWGRPLGAARTALAGLGAEAQSLRDQLGKAEPAVLRATQLEAELAAHRAATDERDRAHAAQLAQLQAEFQRLAGEALASAQARFAEQAAETLKLHRAEAEKGLAENKVALSELIQPVRETLGRYETGLKEMETRREQAYGSLSQQLQALVEAESKMRTEAGRIVAALKGSAKATGAWGEAQLRRVLEVGGLSEGIDFTLQTSVSDGEGGRSRPDAIIHLPGDRQLIVDAKCALDDHVAAQEAAGDKERAEARARHAARVRAHAKSLSEKAYWDQFAEAPDFVLMFVPGENFLSAALEEDSGLHLWAMERKVLLVGPTNLLAIARVVALVWRQEKMARDARLIGNLGAELYAALATMSEHLERLGRNLRGAGDAYNAVLGSLERNILPKARRFPELGVERGKKELEELKPLEMALRPVPEELEQAGARRLPDGG